MNCNRCGDWFNRETEVNVCAKCAQLPPIVVEQKPVVKYIKVKPVEVKKKKK